LRVNTIPQLTDPSRDVLFGLLALQTGLAVFVSLDSQLEREVALKQILDDRADDPSSRFWFLIEAQITGGLEDPGIVPVYGLGTGAYMCPEQAEGQLDRLSPRSDVYSLGATLYCLLTGHPPFAGEVADVILAVQRGELRPPRLFDPSSELRMSSRMFFPGSMALNWIFASGDVNSINPKRSLPLGRRCPKGG
jgi:hypothetical protein